MKFEGEYLNGERLKGKEYEGDKIVFEGEYLNGKYWKGKDKTYYNDILKFECEYLNGKIWNTKIFDYKKPNHIIYEVINGNGIIKQYNNRFLKEYKGEYLNGERNGKGKEYNWGSLVFEGEYLNGERNGKGKEYNIEGVLIFEGEYLNGKRRKGKQFNKEGELKRKAI